MGKMPCEVSIEMEGVGIVAKCHGKTYHAAGSQTDLGGVSYCRYDIPEAERVPGDLNHVYLLFKDGEHRAVGLTSALEDVAKGFVSGVEVTHVMAGETWNMPAVKIDPELLAVLKETVHITKPASGGLRKAIGDVLGGLIRTENFDI